MVLVHTQRCPGLTLGSVPGIEPCSAVCQASALAQCYLFLPDFPFPILNVRFISLLVSFLTIRRVCVPICLHQGICTTLECVLGQKWGVWRQCVLCFILMRFILF